MTRHDNDDIGSLFKAIGAKNNQFKEFSTQNNAVQAQERWPLFKTIDLEKRPPPPQLQNAEKQLWQKKSVAPAPIAPATRKSGSSLGNKIAKGLHTLARPSPASTEAPAPAQQAAAQFGSGLTHPLDSSASHAPPTRRALPGLGRASSSPAPAAIPAPIPTPAAAPASTLFAGRAPAKPSLFSKSAASLDQPPPPATAPHSGAAPAARGLFGKTGAEVAPVSGKEGGKGSTMGTGFGTGAGIGTGNSTRIAAGNSAGPGISGGMSGGINSGKKSLFGKTPATPSLPPADSSNAPHVANAGSGNLSSLFARLEQPEPEPSKGLFGRKRKS
jgi:hypothetical protein